MVVCYHHRHTKYMKKGIRMFKLLMLSGHPIVIYNCLNMNGTETSQLHFLLILKQNSHFVLKQVVIHSKRMYLIQAYCKGKTNSEQEVRIFR